MKMSENNQEEEREFLTKEEAMERMKRKKKKVGMLKDQICRIKQGIESPEKMDLVSFDVKLEEIRSGMIFQIKPDTCDTFGGCLVIVSEPKSWGFQGYIQIPGIDGGQAYVRKKLEEVEFCGFAPWVIQ